MSKLIRGSFKLLDLLVIFMMAFGSPMSALAAPSPTGATIASDAADYPPGATVTLLGAGWQPGESVHIFVNDDAGQTWSHHSSPDPVADGNGAFSYPFTLPSWFVANYSVTAGPGSLGSGTATTTFTDLAIGTYDQCSNDDGNGYASGDEGCRWINGNLQGNNSIYNEGDATVQRLWLTDLVPGSTHTVTFKYGTTKGGKHAYDFLTSWNWSENWITVPDRCQGITGCETATDTQTAIPVDPNAAGFDAAADLIQPRQFTMRGGTLNSATVPVIVSGDYSGDSETVITVSYTVDPGTGAMCSSKQGVTTCGVAIWFGAHVAMTAQWMAYNGTGGAATISGSPYHVALDAVDGAAVGQRDNQMQSGAVPVNGTIVIVKDAVPNDAQDFSFNITNGTTFSQNFTLDDDAGADNIYPNSMSFSLPAGTYTASELNIPGGWTLTNLVCQVSGANGSTTSVNLAGGQATINLQTSFSSSDTVTCTFTDTKIVNQNLTVTKTAVPSFGRTYTWDIYKDVDKTQVNIAEGGTATFNYTVGVTHDNGTDSGFTVSGVITVNNPNPFDIAGVNISNSIDNGGTCSVTNGLNVTVPANSSINRNYSCTFAGNPGSGTNTATATWDAAAYYTPAGSANGTASYDFATVNPSITNGSVDVSDTLGGNLGTVSYLDESPKEFTYSKTFQGVAGTCTDYDNTASLSNGDSDSESVTVCVGKDLTVEKTAEGSYNRTYLWDISKNADETKVSVAEGGSYTFKYIVDVNQTGITDAGWTVTGTITISNPNDWQAVTLTSLSDVVDNGGSCSMTAGPYVVPAGGSINVGYTCSYASEPGSYSGTNTATATWDKDAYFTPTGSDSGSAQFTLSQAGSTDKTITVEDSFAGTLGTVTANDSEPFASKSFTYDRTESGVAGTCTTYDNTATITETGQSADEEVELCVGKDLTVTKTATASKDRLYKWQIEKDVDQTEINIAEGGTATFNYDVTVTPDGIEESGFVLGGTITIANPNDWENVTVDVSDTLDQGGTCSITEVSPYVVPAGDSLTLHYTCTTDGSTTRNDVEVTWDKAVYFTPGDSASNSAVVSFTLDTETNKVITVIDDQTDPLNPVTLGTWDWDDGPHTFEYSLEKQGVAGACTDYTNTAVIDETGQDASQTVTVCVGADLTVTKTASGTFDRTYLWEIFKDANETKVSIAEGGSYTFQYNVDVNQTGIQDSGWEVHGTIKVNNPNDWQAVTLTSLSDVVDNGGTCAVDPGPYVVPAGGSIDVGYTCSFASVPGSYSGTNTATATWDAVAYFTPTGTDSGSSLFTLAQDGSTNKTITVTDSYAGTLGTVTANDSAPYASESFSYSRTVSGEAGTCTTYDNTATITETGQSASESVELCVGSDLTVTKTATTSFTRTYQWTIDKSVDKTKVIIEGANPQSATFNYTVAASHDSGTDSNWEVKGNITVSNPNDWQDITANVNDLVNVGGGASCTVEGDASHSVNVPASGSVTLDYVCTFSSKPAYSGLNTATATWDAAAYFTPNGSTTGTAAVNFTNPTTIVDGSVTVVDDKTDPNNPVTLGSASHTQANPIEFKYSLTKPGVSGDCTDYTNTASFTTNTTGSTGSDSVTVTVCSSNVTVLKLTGVGSNPPAVDPSMTWTFKIFNGPHGSDAPGSGSTWLNNALVSDSTSGDLDGILDFDFYNLSPSKTYALCEIGVPSGYTVEWKVDTNGDGTPDTVVIPYNPNEKDAVPEDIGNRCFDFGAGTSYSIPEGGTLAFQVINHFPGGEPRTPGYWKNWNRCTGGGQAANADRNGGRAKGYTLLEDILNDPGITWDDILGDSFVVPITSCEQAVEILDQRVVNVNGKVGDGKKIASDGARTLAMHLLAAQLNQGNGACINNDIKDVMLWSEKLLDKYNFDGKKSTAYLTSKSADYALALKYAAYLDAYNNSACDFSTLPPKPPAN